MAEFKHNKKHAVDSSTDHTSSITEDNILSADANGLPKDSSTAVSAVTGHIAAANPHSGSAASGANSDITSLTGLTGDVESVNVLNFNITPTNAVPIEGDVQWNNDDHTLNIHTGAGPVLQVGQEMFVYGLNDSGAELNDGDLIYVMGAQGNRPKFLLAKADAEPTSTGTLAMVTQTIANGNNGFATFFGLVRGLDTTVDSDGNAVIEGDSIFLSDANAGGWVNSEPAPPSHSVRAGYVVRKHASEGIIFVRIQNGYEFSEIHDYLETSLADGDIIRYSSGLGYYVNSSSLTDHIASTGADHSYIDQSVVNGASPIFVGTNFTGVLDTGVLVHSSSETLHEFLDDVTLNGFLDETTITDAGGLDISWIVGNEAYVNGTIINMAITGSPYTLDDNAKSYMYATIAGGDAFIISTTPPTGEFSTRATIYTEGGSILKISEEPLLRNVPKSNHDNLDELHSEIVVSGLDIAVDVDGTNANDFTVATGVFYIHAHQRETNDSVFYSAGVGHGESLIERYFHTAGVWGEEDSNGVDFGFWDNGTNKTAVTNVRWYMAPIFWESNGISKADYVYPQTEHLSESDALNEAITYPPYHQGVVVPIGKLIFRGDQSAFGAKAYFVDIRPRHGGGAGSSGVNQNIFQTIASDAGSTTADSATDTLTIAGGTGVSTSVTGDVLTVTGDNASLTAKGIIELSTTAEINAGTADLAMPPDQFKASIHGRKTVTFKAIPDTTALTVADGLFTLTIPEDAGGMNLVGVSAKVYTVSSSGLPTIQLYNITQTADMLTTKITINVSTKHSKDATTPAVIDTANDDVAYGDEIRVDCDLAGTGTLGLEVELVFATP